MNKISSNFLNELFLSCFYKKAVMDVVMVHLDYNHIPNEMREYKKILKSLKSVYTNTGKLPTIGVIAQQHLSDPKVQDKLSKIKETSLADTEILVKTLEDYIKLSKFEILNKKIVDLYNTGNSEEAIALSAKESPEISNFTIKKDTNYFLKVFGDFEKNYADKQDKKESGEHFRYKVPFGIHPIDVATEGGIDRTDTALWILRSGIGKSTAMRWTGMSACRLGFNVLHIQLEGSQQECFDKYGQLWTASLYSDIRDGNINDKRYAALQKNLQWFLSQGRDIYIHAFEQFNTASMIDVRNLIQDFTKVKGEVDLVIIDYLKYLMPGDGIRYGADTQSVKMRKENTADKIKNTAVEFGTRIITADQATDVPMEIWNDPTKVMDRHNISGAKNLPDSFSYVLTGNQTRKEREDNIMRVYFDKVRNYDPQEKVVKIVTNYQKGRFYNHLKTVELNGR